MWKRTGGEEYTAFPLFPFWGKSIDSNVQLTLAYRTKYYVYYCCFSFSFSLFNGNMAL